MHLVEDCNCFPEIIQIPYCWDLHELTNLFVQVHWKVTGYTVDFCQVLCDGWGLHLQH